MSRAWIFSSSSAALRLGFWPTALTPKNSKLVKKVVRGPSFIPCQLQGLSAAKADWVFEMNYVSVLSDFIYQFSTKREEDVSGARQQLSAKGSPDLFLAALNAKCFSAYQRKGIVSSSIMVEVYYKMKRILCKRQKLSILPEILITKRLKKIP